MRGRNSLCKCPVDHSAQTRRRSGFDRRQYWRSCDMKNLGRIVIAALVMTTFVSAAAKDLRLPDAAMNGDSATVYSLLKQPGVDVNAAQGDGSTSLHWAA